MKNYLELKHLQQLLSSTGIEDFSLEEISITVGQMKNRTVTGPDEIPSELWTQCNESGTLFFLALFIKIKYEGPMPYGFRERFQY